MNIVLALFAIVIAIPGLLMASALDRIAKELKLIREKQ